jgi:hypothetical protein
MTDEASTMSDDTRTAAVEAATIAPREASIPFCAPGAAMNRHSCRLSLPRVMAAAMRVPWSIATRRCTAYRGVRSPRRRDRVRSPDDAIEAATAEDGSHRCTRKDGTPH